MSEASIGRADLDSPLRRVSDDGSGGLPRPLTSFIGRERELAEARRLLTGSCLLTLTGPGGVGKMRLCLELAGQTAADYPDGVYFVRLAPVREPGLVPSSIAQGLGLPDSGGRPLAEHLASYLRDRKLLLVLDNFEHLLAAAPVVAGLLSQARDLRIVVTSRAPLRVSGEQECPVPPLTLPRQDPAAAAASESVRLFAERAAAAVPGFTVDQQNVDAVAEIVDRLDGLPLAIELAAARIRLLPPEAICGRLEHSLGLLTGGGRDLPDRQRTLRATIEWSYDLLGEEARRLLAACSVFRGGVPLEVIEPVCAQAAAGVRVLDGLQELVDQSLLRQERSSGGPRYAMLETIREFAAERLVGTPEASGVHRAHAAAFLVLVEEAGRAMTGPGQPDWLSRLDVKHNNLRAAMDWLGRDDPPAALRMAAALWLYWSLHGHFTEGRERLRHLLGLVPDETTVRVRALNAAGWLALDQGDYPDADRLLGESTELSRKLEDRIGEGMAAAFRSRSLLSSGREAEGGPYAEQAFALLTEAGDRPGIAFALFYRALDAQFGGRLEVACELQEQCVARCRELGFTSLRARGLQLLGIARLVRGDLPAARAGLREGLPTSISIGDRFVIPVGLSGFAGLAAKSGQHRKALRLAGAAEACREAYQSALPEPNRAYLDDWLAPALRAASAAAGKLVAEGRQMTLAAAVSYALADEPERYRRDLPRQDLTRRGVAARVRGADGRTRMITADYVVGCDGAHSRVRHELGLPFHGHPYPEDWLLADVRLDWARADGVVHAFFRAAGGPLVCFPMREDRWRLVLPLAGDRVCVSPDLAEIQRLVDQRAPEPVAVSDPTWLASFRCHRRSTDVYRRGRVLLAGDAVHIHTPAGGQGMNTGITDAHNLGWKLALVAAGRAPGELLDTYGREREPVAARVLGLTHTLVRIGTVTHPVKLALRDAIVPAAFRVTPLHRRAVRRWDQVDVGYPACDLTQPGGGRGRPSPGQRVPDLEVRTPEGNSRLFAVLRGARHVMVVTGADPARVAANPALQPYRDLFQVVGGLPGPGWASRPGSVVLVRPDGYVAARGRAYRLDTVLGYLRRLASQPAPEPAAVQ